MESLPPTEFLSALTDDERARLAASAQLMSYEMGERIVDAGAPAEGIYIVRSGRVRLFEVLGDQERSVGIRKQGEVIGELAALREVQHEFSLRSSSRTELIFVPRRAFAAVLKGNGQAEEFMATYAAIRATGGMMGQLFDLGGKIAPDDLRELVATVGIKAVPAGERIIEQEASEDRRLYVVRSGRVRLTREDSGQSYDLGLVEQGNLFGERGCLMNQPSPVRAEAESRVVLLVVPQRTVRAILEQNPTLKSTFEDRITALDREFSRQQKVRELAQEPLLRLDLKSRSGPGRRVLKRFPLVPQAEEMDCGAACLTMICRHHGLSLTLGRVRELVGVGIDGSSLDNIAHAAESLGFTTRGVQASLSALKSFELPFIAHWEGYHFVVVYGLSDEHVWVADPGPGFRKLTVEEFERGWTGSCLLLTPADIKAATGSGRSPWLRFTRYLKPHTRTIGHMFLAALVVQLLNLAPPVITQNVFDRVIVHDSQDLLLYLIIALVLAQAFAQLTTLTRGYLANYMVRGLDFAMMSRFFQHTLALPVAFFANRRAGDVVARFHENATIRDFLTGQTIGTVLNVLMAFIYLVVLFMYSAQLTLLLLALIVPIFLLTVLVTPRMKDYGRQTFEATTDAEGVLMETINAAESVKGMGIERQARLKWEKRYVNALNVQYRAEGFRLKFDVASQLLNVIATSAVLFVGASMVISQELSIGQLIAFNMLSASVMTPLLGLVGLWDELHAAGVAIERLSDVLDLEPEQTAEDMGSKIVIPELEGAVRFQNVSFRYTEPAGPLVLRDVSFEISPGEMVAVVGPSGSGKSTLAKLLVGFHAPTDGKVLIDGYDLEDIELNRYRAQIGYVMQSNLLFQGTVAENITVGDDEPDRLRMIEAARLADAHSFVTALPMGYEHRVGERGVGLSGGQIQRLCIARALYRSPRILVFDEATSALDTESESNILNAMDGMLNGRTALVIAHRFSTILRADRIVVLHNGTVAEVGTHDELLNNRGMYYQLVSKQMSDAA
ncbi:MAG: peptidase domain-containing ABC transporter [Pseudomonadota bacterium]